MSNVHMEADLDLKLIIRIKESKGRLLSHMLTLESLKGRPNLLAINFSCKVIVSHFGQFLWSHLKFESLVIYHSTWPGVALIKLFLGLPKFWSKYVEF